MRVYTITKKERIGQFINDLALDLNRWNGDSPLKVTIQNKKEKRSLEQNALYFMWCQIIADETGHDKDDIHEFCKAKFLGTKFVSFGDTEGCIIPLSTKNQSVGSMAEYMEKIQAWALMELNIKLPTPDDLIDYSQYER